MEECRHNSADLTSNKQQHLEVVRCDNRLADCFIAKNKTYNLKPAVNKFMIYKLYMNEIFTILEEKSDHFYVLKIFNNANSSVKFTLKGETNAALAIHSMLDFCKLTFAM